jgi:hypothetical protein
LATTLNTHLTIGKAKKIDEVLILSIKFAVVPKKTKIMKGIIFTEFIEMVEDKFGFEVSDRIISRSELSSGAAYTAVGTYDFSEMLQLLTHLSKETDQPIPDLLVSFGHHLFSRFRAVYPHFFIDETNAFDFLSNIDEYIHVEVLKLYPDAQLPTIDTHISEDGKSMKMKYKSSRKLGNLAYGLMTGCIDYFNEKIKVEISEVSNDGTEVTFVLTKEH